MAFPHPGADILICLVEDMQIAVYSIEPWMIVN